MQMLLLFHVRWSVTITVLDWMAQTMSKNSMPNRIRKKRRGKKACDGREIAQVMKDRASLISLEGIAVRIACDGEFNEKVFDSANCMSKWFFTEAPAMTTHSIVCDNELLTKVNAEKAALTDLWVHGKERFYRARARSNPYELISATRMFQNRAALKLAELDAMFRPKLTDVPLVMEERGILFFVDLCAGPGGFSEYLYWRRKWRCKGWAFTLKGICDIDITRFQENVPIETFEIEYGACGDGDIYRKRNIQSLREKILTATQNRGVALVTADGGFSTEGDWYRQEFLTKRLILCEFLTALCILRSGGTFVCKMFDTFQDFTLELIYLMTLLFVDVHVIKPIQSRPANSERYLVCRGLRHVPQMVIDYLFAVNDVLEDLGFDHAHSKPAQDLPHILSIQSASFLDSMKSVVELICQQQLKALCDIQRYYRNTKLRPSCDQHMIQKRALALWKVSRSDIVRVDIRKQPYGPLKDVEAFHHLSSIRERIFSGKLSDNTSVFVVCQADWSIGFLTTTASFDVFEPSKTLTEQVRNSVFIHNAKLPRGCVFVAEQLEDNIIGIIDVHTLCGEIVTGANYHCRLQKIQTILYLSKMCGASSLIQLHPKIYCPIDPSSVPNGSVLLRFPACTRSCQKAMYSYRRLRYLPDKKIANDSTLS